MNLFCYKNIYPNRTPGAVWLDPMHLVKLFRNNFSWSGEYNLVYDEAYVRCVHVHKLYYQETIHLEEKSSEYD